MTITQGRLVFTKLWLPILLVLHQAGTSQAENAWNSIIAGLSKLDGPAFRDQVAAPLVEMSANAYRYPDQASVEIPGWVVSTNVAPVAPAEGGVHAHVYEVRKPHIDFQGFTSKQSFSFSLTFRSSTALLCCISRFAELWCRSPLLERLCTPGEFSFAALQSFFGTRRREGLC